MNSSLSTVAVRTSRDTSANFANSSDVTPLFKGDPNVKALRASNALFRRNLIEPDLPSRTQAPVGSCRILNGDQHDDGFVQYVVRQIAYAPIIQNGDPNDCQDLGELTVDGLVITWAITLDTPCGTLMSAQGQDPATIERQLLITLPDLN
jgi:hypothetical protein